MSASASLQNPPVLDVSVVVHAPDPHRLGVTLDSLAKAAARFNRGPVRLFLIDNGPADNRALLTDLAPRTPVLSTEIIGGHGNIGYGAGHNLALVERGGAEWHLVLNPDVTLEADALARALVWAERHPDAVLVAPRISGPDGAFQALCKRRPDPLVLLLRGFAPPGLQRLFARRLSAYELRDWIGPSTEEPVWDVPVVSGCCMLIRAASARAIGGFDPAYFLYFEDFDLSLRLASLGRTVYLPAMRIVHDGGGAARKGWRHIALFARAAVRFFRRHGMGRCL